MSTAPNTGNNNFFVRWLSRAPHAISSIILAVGVLTSVAVGLSLLSIQYSGLTNILTSRTIAYDELITSKVNAAQAEILNAGEWWSSLNGTPQMAWHADGLVIFRDISSIVRLEWIDNDLNIRWHISPQEEDFDAEKTRSLTPEQREFLNEDHRGQHALELTTLSAEPMLDIFVPIRKGDSSDGFIRGTIDLSKVFSSSYRELNLVSNARVYDGEQMIYETGGSPVLTNMVVSSPIDAENFHLIARLRPSVDFVTQNTSLQPLLIFFAALALTIMSALILRQYTRLVTQDVRLARSETALRDTKEQASAHAAHIENVYEVVPVGLCLVDQEMRFLYGNERFVKMYGKTLLDYAGRTPKEVDAGFGERIEPFLKHVLETGQVLEGVEIVDSSPHKDVPERSWVYTFHPSYDQHEKQIGAIIAALEITNLKEAEQEKLDLSKRLFVAQKTEALGRLTGGIAHDFNNMLGVILGTLEFLKEKVANDADASTLVARIETAAEHSSDLIRQLLAFARQQPLVAKNIDIKTRMENLMPLLRRSIDEDIEIHIFSAPDVWQARIDPSQLESAVLNLVINARDAMPNGGQITIEVSNAVLDDSYTVDEVEVSPGDYVAISVSDTGTGMSPETVARAFEPFFTTKEGGKGSGLGLSMVFGFIKQSHGHVKIYSEVGHGTAIKLYLPRSYDSSSLSESHHETAAVVRGNEKILLVEDDNLMRETAARQIKALGYSLLEANSGEAALQVLNDHPVIDLLITDVVMPGGMNGPELARRVLATRPDIKVMFVSGYTDNALIDRGWLEKGIQLLQKPYRRADLAAKIRQTLSS